MTSRSPSTSASRSGVLPRVQRDDVPEQHRTSPFGYAPASPPASPRQPGVADLTRRQLASNGDSRRTHRRLSRARSSRSEGTRMITKQGRHGRRQPVLRCTTSAVTSAASCATRTCRRRSWRCCARRSTERPTTRRWSSWAASGSPTTELWDRAARVAGGLRAAGVERGDRVAIRLANGNDWALAFWGIQMAGAVVVPVNTRFTAVRGRVRRVATPGAASCIEPGAPLPDGEPLRGRRPQPMTTSRRSSTRAAPRASRRAR